MKRIICWLFGHRWAITHVDYDDDRSEFKVTPLCPCSRCGCKPYVHFTRGW